MFMGGLLALVVALNGPLHDLSDHYLFSAHMVQHLVLTLVVPAAEVGGTEGMVALSLVAEDFPALTDAFTRAATRCIRGTGEVTVDAVTTAIIWSRSAALYSARIGRWAAASPESVRYS